MRGLVALGFAATATAALAADSALESAASLTGCGAKTGDDLDLCLGALCHPARQTGLAGKGVCWHEGKYLFAQDGLFNSGDACGTSAADFMCKRCARGTTTPASTTRGFASCVADATTTTPTTAPATTTTTAAPASVCFTLASCGCVVLPSGELKSCNPPKAMATMNLNASLLDGVRISRILPGAFLGLADVVELNLGGHGLTELRDGLFEGMPKLAALTLRANSIATVGSKAFAGLAALDTLDLAINSIREIPADVFAGIEPRTVVLSSNPMTAPGTLCPQGTMRVTLMAASADVCYRANPMATTTTTTTGLSTAATTAAPSAPATCEVSAWGSWTGCLPACGASRTRTRSRALTKAGAVCTQELLQAEACASNPCPADPSAVQQIVDVSDEMQQGQYPWLMGGGGKNMQPDAKSCEALCLRTPECVYGTFVTGSANLVGAFHNYNTQGFEGECWLASSTHRIAKRCDVPCHSFRKAPKVPTPAPAPVEDRPVEPRFRAKVLRLYDPCDCDPRVHRATHVSCRQDPFGGHIFMKHLGPRLDTGAGAPGGMQHHCGLVGKGDCRCCTCQGEAVMHGIRDLQSGKHAEVNQFLFGGGRNNLVPSLALCKRKCFESNGCTTGTYILEGTRKGQCWLSGEIIGAGAGKPIPLLSCGVPCRSFVKGDGGWTKSQSGSLVQTTRSPLDALRIRDDKNNLLQTTADGYITVPDVVPATLPRILSVDQPPVPSLALDEELNLAEDMESAIPEPDEEENMPAQPEDLAEEDEEDEVGGVGALFRGGNAA